MDNIIKVSTYFSILRPKGNEDLKHTVNFKKSKITPEIAIKVIWLCLKIYGLFSLAQTHRVLDYLSLRKK